MTGGIKKIVLTVLALIWLALEVVFLFSVSTIYGENQAHHYMEIPQFPDGMMVTLNRDITVSESTLGSDKKITIKAGTVVHPEQMWHSVVFNYQGKGYYGAALEDFKEQDQQKKIIDETNEKKKKKREQIARENIDMKLIAAGICWLLIGSVLTFVLQKKDWLRQLFVIHVALIPVFLFTYCSVLSTLCH